MDRWEGDNGANEVGIGPEKITWTSQASKANGVGRCLPEMQTLPRVLASGTDDAADRLTVPLAWVV